MVEALLEDVDAGWPAFRDGYRRLLEARWAEDPAPFEALAERARRGDAFLGCNCPTRRQPDVRRCHTALALAFMKERFGELEVVLV